MAFKSNTRRKSRRLLSHTRPVIPSGSQVASTLSSKATRTLIRSHHELHKKLRQAETAGDRNLAENFRAQIEAQGGLAKYQEASIQGQSAERGGDSSKVLVEWLLELDAGLQNEAKHTKLRLLEVGALRVDNACSVCGLFEVERIDLNSQHVDISQQDFMQRPLPLIGTGGDHRFDVVSLSLVVNYVPDPVRRGEMLKRISSFLRSTASDIWGLEQRCDLFPGLFLVLPSSCVTNSRYLNQQKLEDMMGVLGYVVTKKKLSSKLVYYYFTWSAGNVRSAQSFAKKEIKAGGNRNNFAIVLQ